MVPGIGHFEFLKHLAHDHFDMLVIDRHALQAINLLDFVDEIICQALRCP